VPRISPFVGLLFDPSVVGSHEAVTTPPYDVIPDDDRRRYLDASPYNVIRLDLGSGEPDDVADDRYRGASNDLRSWIDAGALRPTPEPAYFPYEMRGSWHGRPIAVRGVICAVDLEALGGSIVPHERTMEGPIEDRLRLLREVRANLSSIYAVFRGPNPLLGALVDEATAGAPEASMTDESGVEHRLWVARPDPALPRALEADSLMIADGHHRYATALRYRDEMHAEHGPGPWDRVMMLVVDASAEEPPVLPFHRIQVSGPVQAAGHRVRDLAEVLEAVSDEQVRYGMAAVEDGVLVYRIADLSGEPPAVGPLHDQVLRGLDDELRFTPDAVVAEAAVRNGDAVAAYFLAPTEAGRIRAVVDRGDRLPQKSTFFWPKPRTGLVIRPLDPPRVPDVPTSGRDRSRASSTPTQ
jgi:uncharacterized protein (DUF1015 family)